MLTVATGVGKTVSVAIPVKPSTVAEMFVVPAAMATTAPDAPTLATLGDDDDHEIVRPASVLPLASRTIAIADVLEPANTVDAASVIARLVAGTGADGGGG